MKRLWVRIRHEVKMARWFVQYYMIMIAIRLGWSESHVLNLLGADPRDYNARVGADGITWTPKPATARRMQEEANERHRMFAEMLKVATPAMPDTPLGLTTIDLGARSEEE